MYFPVDIIIITASSCVKFIMKAVATARKNWLLEFKKQT